MKRFINDTHGSSTLLAAFLAAILCLLSLIVYSVTMVSANYEVARTEIERASIIAVNDSLFNYHVRDLVFDIPISTALEKFEQNLVSTGLIKDSDRLWKRAKDGSLVYELKDLNASVEDDMLHISGQFIMPLSWSLGSEINVSIPINVQSRVFYHD